MLDSQEGILWRGYEDALVLLREHPKPVLLFVRDEDPMHWPFLREIFLQLPKSEKLRRLLAADCVAMLVPAKQVPDYLAALGAGIQYHIAILSPSGLTPMAIFNHLTGKPEVLVNEISEAVAVSSQFWH